MINARPGVAPSRPPLKKKTMAADNVGKPSTGTTRKPVSKPYDGGRRYSRRNATV